MFEWIKRDPTNELESYSEYETDNSCYVPDDMSILPETDSDEAKEFVDDTIVTYSVENLEAGLAKIRDGFTLATQGYEHIQQELPNLDPLEVPKLIEDRLLPQLQEHTKPMQQLLAHASEKTIVECFIKQLLGEGCSVHAIKKEFRLPYNLVYEVAHKTERPGGTQYLKQKSTPTKRSKGKKNP